MDSETQREFLTQIQADTEFLQTMKLVDYSLLIFIVKMEQKTNKEAESGKRLTPSNPLVVIENLKKPGFYYNVGIVHYLKRYDLNKAVENWMKRCIDKNLRSNKNNQKPVLYSSNFRHFMQRIADFDVREEHGSHDIEPKQTSKYKSETGMIMWSI